MVYGLTVTFAMVDWTMSVNPHWFSTIWGLLYIGGQGLSALAFAIVVLVMLSQTRAAQPRASTPHHFHDLGKLLFAFLMLWAYLSFSQFLIIWSANIAEEIPHYLDRWDERLAVRERVHRSSLHFVAALRAAAVARPQARLAAAAHHRDLDRGIARVVDYYWHVAPEFHNDGLSASACSTSRCRSRSAASSCCCSCRSCKGRSLLPVNDPGLAKALTHHVH